MSARVALLENLAGAVPVHAGRPVCVAIDGMTGVGKSTFRGELAMALIAAGRQVLEASGDDFHHVRDHRYEQGKSSPVGYFEDAYDYEAMALKLFKPLEPGGDGAVRLRHHDLESDQILVAEPVVEVAKETVVLVDGSFLLKPEIAAYWDVHVLLEVSRATSVSRQVARDGGPTDPAHPYYERYFGGYEVYLERCDPRARADFIIDNTDLERPFVVT